MLTEDRIIQKLRIHYRERSPLWFAVPVGRQEDDIRVYQAPPKIPMPRWWALHAPAWVPVCVMGVNCQMPVSDGLGAWAAENRCGPEGHPRLV